MKLFFFACILMSAVCPFTAFPDGSVLRTAVVSDPDDPYRVLAEEIAEELQVPVLDSADDYFRDMPEIVVYTASPAFISDIEFTKIGRRSLETGYFPAIGLITGASMEEARELWKRGAAAAPGPMYLASDADAYAGITTGEILRIDREQIERAVLDRAGLVESLGNAACLYWSRHVSKSRWFWRTGPGTGAVQSISASDLPAMGPAVIHTPACGSFYPWEQESISAEFIRRGAAAYAGNVYSPFSNQFFIGHMRYLPPRYAWSGFPYGLLVQVQNRNAARNVMSVPSFYLAGDPWITLSDGAPYEIHEDSVSGSVRTITGFSAVRGVLPVRIPGGADYSFVTLETASSAGKNGPETFHAVTSVWYGDPFFNGRLQPLKLGGDLFLLVLHEGGGFRLTFRIRPPLLHILADPVLDSLDYSWIAIGNVNSPFSIVLLVLFGIVFLWKLIRKKTVRISGFPFAAAFVFACLYILYVALRHGTVTVSAYSFRITALQYIYGFIGMFSSIAAGLIVLDDARTLFGRIGGLTLSVLPRLPFAAFYAGAVVLTNMRFSSLHPEHIALWNGNLILLPSLALAAEAVLFVSVHLIRHTLKTLGAEGAMIRT